ncbi:MAG: hypothetical protein U0Z53_03295 [Blastocatellia bacterium]
MAEPVRQRVTIKVEDGRISVVPRIRDLYLGEEVEWVCEEEGWEVIFDENQDQTPFVSDAFGPGMESSMARTETGLPADELPKYLTGKAAIEAEDGGTDFRYTARVRGFSPRSARVRIFRGIRTI